MLDKDSFEVKDFPDGKKYVVYTKDELVEGGYTVGTLLLFAFSPQHR